ncbi:MAG: hypothetical protein HYV60_03860 [Planctomycetia bacterium]|nr:hypothetical protein [Planctomycetia bacterium]
MPELWRVQRPRASRTVSLSPPDSTSASSAELRDFTLWLLATLGCECRCEREAIIVETVPESLRTKIGCAASLCLKFSAAGAIDQASLVTLDSPLLRSLIDELKATQIVGRAAPADQPESVRDVSQRLFDAYTVDGGSVHLAGCTLEDRAILRVSYVDRSDASSKTPRLNHYFLTLSGQLLGTSLVERLGLKHLVPLTRPIRMADEQYERWRHIAETTVRGLEQTVESDFLLTTVVWCKYAEGKLAFVIGDATTSIAFSGWAHLFVDGSEKPPVLACQSYPQGSPHLAATDDGKIVPFEAVVTCSESGKRVVAGELETCQATGSKALPEFFVSCPASGARVLRKALVACATCQQMVSPTSCDAKQCSACRSLTKVRKSDPRMARLLDEYPKLDRLPWWKIAETTAAYVLVASSLAKRLLIVIDKDNLKVLRLAKGSQFSSKWTEATEVDRTAYLQ